MNRNTYYTLLDTLYYNSLLSSQVFKIDSSNNLQIVELSALKSRNENIPLDMIDAEPKLSSKADRQLISFSIISAFLCATSLIAALYATQTWMIPFSVLFLLTSIVTAVASFKNKTIIYAYQYIDSNTPLFTLQESSSGNKQVEMFSHKLSERINTVNQAQEIAKEKVKSDIKELSDNMIANTKEDDNYLQFRDHLNFLYNHGVVNDNLYQRIDNKIKEVVFGLSNQEGQSNILQFPVKAS